MSDDSTNPGSDDRADQTIDHRRNAIDDVARFAESWLPFQAAALDAVGVQAALRFRGELVLNTAWGRSNLATDEPLSTGHLFKIASHSKTFTAVLIAQMVERGTLRFDDSVGEWIPELATSDLADRTIRELLGHQGGVIRDGVAADYWQRATSFPDRAKLIEICTSGAAVYERNQYFKYSNIGYGLLGLIIEAASGQSYAECGAISIAHALGLNDLGADHDPSRDHEYAGGHTGRIAARDQQFVIPHVTTNALAAATGWYSTAADLTAYLWALRPGDQTLVSDDSKRLLYRQESTVPFGRDRRHYGLGFSVEEIGDSSVVGHSGGYPGHITRSWLGADDEIALSVLTNSLGGPADPLATGLIGIIQVALRYADEELPKAADAADLVGRYANFWGVIDIVKLGGALVMLSSQQSDPGPFAQRIIDDGDGGLRFEPRAGFEAVGEHLVVERDADGSITTVVAGAMSFVPFDDYVAGLHHGATDQWHGRMAL